MPPIEDIGAIVQASGHCAESMMRLYMRVISDLALAAEMAETAVGMAPLPDLPEKDEVEADA